MKRRALALGSGLQARLGLAPGQSTFVGLLVGNSLEVCSYDSTRGTVRVYYRTGERCLTSSAFACRCLSWSARASSTTWSPCPSSQALLATHSSTFFDRVRTSSCFSSLCDLPDSRGSYLWTLLYLAILVHLI